MDDILDKLRVAIANDTSGELRQRVAAGCRLLLATLEQVPAQAGVPLDTSPTADAPTSAGPAPAGGDPLGALFDRLIAKYEPMLPEKRPLAPIFPLRFVPLR